MAHFLVVGRENDEEQSSVTAFNMRDVHRLFWIVDEPDLCVTVRDVLEPDEEPDYIATNRFEVCHESEVLNEMRTMVINLQVAAERKKKAVK